ncbi:MAG: preprotein translocase subunit SecG [Planctomycetota bacterium]|nr:preprotein translocase subunit SecG [Planctomycetota bacterium]
MGLIILEFLLFAGSLFMMLLILVQRGKGGGLTGALGGMGGQSAFGAKAGDVFTKVTVITSIIWITLCMLTIAWFNPPPAPPQAGPAPPSMTSGVDDAEEAKDDALMEQVIKDQNELGKETDSPSDQGEEEKLKQQIEKDKLEIEGKSDPAESGTEKKPETSGPDLNAPETQPDTNTKQGGQSGESKSSDQGSSNGNG